MLVSRKWLNDFVDIPASLSDEEFGELLTLHTVEVEGFESAEQMLAHIVVGEVESVSKHPNADKLRVCDVNLGDGSAHVVCGGVNLKEGMKVAFGKIGASVRWHGEGDLVELKKTKIRGEVSEGMICAADEIGLGELFPKQHDAEIVDLTHLDARPGMPLVDALELDDTVFDVDNKSMTHRPDLWGHYGMAREVAALLHTPLKAYAPPSIKEGNELSVKVAIDVPEMCSRYMSVAIEGIHIEPSPAWMQKRLLAAGMRPINNIVDITNFVMLELGQPTHAFDFDRLKNDGKSVSIRVRQAEEGEPFTTLDGVERSLGDEMFVVDDGEKSILAGGIMGGANSDVNDKTTRIVFESANFDARTVRRMSQALGLRTDGSSRWEKSQDPNNAEIGLRRLVELTLQICPGARVASNVADVSNFYLEQGPIELSLSFLQKKIGVELSAKQVTDMLTSLGFGVEVGGKKLFGKNEEVTFSVTVPTWRATKDISIPEDLIEEVARIYGYGNIPTTMPKFAIAPAPRNALRETEVAIKKILAYECGYTEVYNYSFVSPEWLGRLGLNTGKHIELDNPLAKDRPLVRRHLLPNMLQNLEENLHRYETVNIFEHGLTYHKEKKGVFAEPVSDAHLPGQESQMIITSVSKGQEQPFYVVADALKRVFGRLHVDYKLHEGEPSKEVKTLYHPGRHAEVKIGGAVVGLVAELHPKVQQEIGIPHRVGILELNIQKIVDHATEFVAYEPLPIYPSVMRDIAFSVEKSISHGDMRKAIGEVDKTIRSVVLFDVYSGEHVKDGEKSVAYRIEYRSEKETLTAEAVEEVHNKVIAALKKKFSVEIR